MNFGCNCRRPLLYYDDISPQARSCFVLVKMLQLNVDLCLVNLINGEHMTPEYNRINPSGTVPTLIDGRLTLYDSHTIMIYLCDKYMCAYQAKLCPQRYITRMLLLNVLFYEGCVLYRRHSQLVTAIVMDKYSNVNMDYHQRKIVDCYNTLNSFLIGHCFMVGNCITIADISIVSTVGALHLIFPINRILWPNLYTWFMCLSSMPWYIYNARGIEKQRKLLKNVGEFLFPTTHFIHEILTRQNSFESRPMENVPDNSSSNDNDNDNDNYNDNYNDNGNAPLGIAKSRLSVLTKKISDDDMTDDEDDYNDEMEVIRETATYDLETDVDDKLNVTNADSAISQKSDAISDMKDNEKMASPSNVSIEENLSVNGLMDTNMQKSPQVYEEIVNGLDEEIVLEEEEEEVEYYYEDSPEDSEYPSKNSLRTTPNMDNEEMDLSNSHASDTLDKPDNISQREIPHSIDGKGSSPPNEIPFTQSIDNGQERVGDEIEAEVVIVEQTEIRETSKPDLIDNEPKECHIEVSLMEGNEEVEKEKVTAIEEKDDEVKEGQCDAKLSEDDKHEDADKDIAKDKDRDIDENKGKDYSMPSGSQDMSCPCLHDVKQSVNEIKYFLMKHTENCRGGSFCNNFSSDDKQSFLKNLKCFQFKCTLSPKGCIAKRYGKVIQELKQEFSSNVVYGNLNNLEYHDSANHHKDYVDELKNNIADHNKASKTSNTTQRLHEEHLYSRENENQNEDINNRLCNCVTCNSNSNVKKVAFCPCVVNKNSVTTVTKIQCNDNDIRDDNNEYCCTHAINPKVRADIKLYLCNDSEINVNDYNDCDDCNCMRKSIGNYAHHCLNCVYWALNKTVNTLVESDMINGVPKVHTQNQNQNQDQDQESNNTRVNSPNIMITEQAGSGQTSSNLNTKKGKKDELPNMKDKSEESKLSRLTAGSHGKSKAHSEGIIKPANLRRIFRKDKVTDVKKKDKAVANGAKDLPLENNLASTSKAAKLMNKSRSSSRSKASVKRNENSSENGTIHQAASIKPVESKLKKMSTSKRTHFPKNKTNQKTNGNSKTSTNDTCKNRSNVSTDRVIRNTKPSLDHAKQYGNPITSTNANFECPSISKRSLGGAANLRSRTFSIIHTSVKAKSQKTQNNLSATPRPGCCQNDEKSPETALNHLQLLRTKTFIDCKRVCPKPTVTLIPLGHRTENPHSSVRPVIQNVNCNLPSESIKQHSNTYNLKIHENKLNKTKRNVILNENEKFSSKIVKPKNYKDVKGASLTRKEDSDNVDRHKKLTPNRLKAGSSPKRLDKFDEQNEIKVLFHKFMNRPEVYKTVQKNSSENTTQINSCSTNMNRQLKYDVVTNNTKSNAETDHPTNSKSCQSSKLSKLSKSSKPSKSSKSSKSSESSTSNKDYNVIADNRK